MSPSEDLRALISQVRGGDVTALERLVAELEVRLLPFVRRGLQRRNVEDPATAEEIVQDAIYRFYCCLADWDPTIDRSGIAFVSAIANNLVITHVRKPRHELQTESLPQQSGGETPADEVVHSAETAALQEALATLPEDVGAILMARFFEGRRLSDLLRERGRTDYQWFYHHEYLPALEQLRQRLGPWFPEFAGARRQADE